MMDPGPLAALEAVYLEARDARDRLDVARARGEPADTTALEAAAGAATSAFHRLETSIGPDLWTLDPEDRRAFDAMRDGMRAAVALQLPVVPVMSAVAFDAEGVAAAIDAGGEALRWHTEAAYVASGARIAVGDETLTRLQLLARLAAEPEVARRRELFMALEPVWRSVDGDGVGASPYQAFIHEAARGLRAGRSPIAASARALGVATSDIETWALTVLAAWRAAVVEPGRSRGEAPIEPWDWWWLAGAASRAMSPALPAIAVREVNRAVHASLGADLDALGVEFDLESRPSRPAVTMAFTTFGERPRRRDDGSWSPGRPTVIANFSEGGLSELVELVHETGHAIHIAAIRTRPAFADWPDSDALTEGIADVVALDITEPAWQQRWLPSGASVPADVASRCRYAAVALDAAWALFEIRLLASPDRLPNDVWTEITSVWLGITRHPDLSWWAIRGQLVEEPGYMANYAIGAVLAADIRAAIRSVRGDWIDGDPGWYEWVSEHLYRFGRERSTREVLHGLLGRPPTADALLVEIAKAGRTR